MPSPEGDATYVDYAGLRLIKNVEIEIGGQRINNLVGAEKHQTISKLYNGMEKNFSGVQQFLPQMLVGVT